MIKWYANALQIKGEVNYIHFSNFERINLKYERSKVMKKSIDCVKYMLLLVVAVLMCIPVQARAEAYGDFEYNVEVDSDTDEKYAVITGYKGSDTDVVIPEEISGIPVTCIGYGAFCKCSCITNITISDSVTVINNFAFKDCSRLTSITIPNGVTEIGRGAFYNCEKLTDITIPDGVVSIEAYTFYECRNLKNLKKILNPKSVASIGIYAFSVCDDLTNVVIPSTVTDISDSAFENCYSLRNITIPDSVISIGDSAFDLCSYLTIYCNKGSYTEKYAKENGLSYNEYKGEYRYEVENNTDTGEKYVNITGYIGDDSNVLIPSNIEGLPVRKISGYGDGEYFSDIKSAFYEWEGLESIIIPNSVTAIGDRAFAECHNLKSITIPDSVISIGDSAFARCSTLTEINVSENNKYYTNGGGSNAIYKIIGDGYLKLIRGCATTVIRLDVTEICSDAFSGCKALKSISIPKGVTSIGNSAFAECGGLKNITIPKGVTRIGSRAFWCSGLKNITIPNSVVSIGVGAFEYCGLTNITIPDSVVSIGGSAFTHNSFTSIIIPDSVTEIGGGAFYGCGNLESVKLPKGLTSLSGLIFGGCKKLTSITIPEGVTSIGDEAFWECNGLKKVVIPERVTSIGRYAFFDCFSLSDITIPNSVTSIGCWAFAGNNALKSIVIPDGVSSIESKNFCSEYGMTVYCHKNTNAERSLKDAGIPYKYIGSDTPATSTDAPVQNITDITKAESKVEVSGIVDITYTGKALTQTKLVVKAGSRTLKVDRDYKVSYANNVNPGKATLTITGIGDYKGSITRTFIIIKKSAPSKPAVSVTDITKEKSKVKISGIVDMIYTGKALTLPKLAVSVGGKVLKIGKDYTVNYADNVNVGKAIVTVTGINNYSGTLIRTFKITKKTTPAKPAVDITKASSKITVKGITRKIYTGKKCTQPKLVVKAGTKKLKAGTDYKVTYANNVKPGKATVKITGINAYKGTIKKTFAIILPKNATYVVGGMKYKVTNAATNGKGTLKVIGTTKTRSNRKFTSLTVNSTVTIGVVKYKVTAINANAFKDYKYLKKVVIGDGIKTIGDKAFYGCSKLRSVTIKSSKITKFGKKTFSRIAAKPVVKIPKAVAKRYKKLLKSAGITSKGTFILTNK